MISLRWRSRWRKKSSASLSRLICRSSILSPGVESELAEERHEPDVRDGRGPNLVALPLHQGEHLGFPVAERNHEAAARGELLEQGGGHRGGGGGDEEGGVRGGGAPN